MKKIIYTLIIALFSFSIQTQAQTTTQVGTIPGQVSVSQGGGATYNIPIEVPAGINGMQPNLSLSYNSQGGDGPFGVGWSLNGLSVIYKSVKNIINDNTISGIEDNTSNVYMLDGQRLFIKELVQLDSTYSSTDHTDMGFDFLESIVGSTYQTQNKDYSKIETFGIAGYINGLDVNSPWTIINKGFKYFKVTSKDGYIREYKITANMFSNIDSQPLTWYLNKVTDPNGNCMIYEYETSEGQTILKKISYTGNGETKLPFQTIEFTYDTKTASYTYVGSNKRANKFLLTNISIKSSTTTLKSYSFTYENRNDKYYMKDVTLTGLDSMKLNATSFEWGADNTVINVNKLDIPQSSPIQSVNNIDKHWISADINGDGLTDALCIYPITTQVNDVNQIKNYIQVMKTVSANGQVHFENDVNYLIQNDFSYDDIKSLNPSIRTADLYGNNKDEIIIPQLIQSNGDYSIQFNIPGVGSIQQTLQSSTEIPVYAVGDINNDGKDEIIYIEKGKVNNLYYPGKIGYTLNSQFVWEDKQFILPHIPKGLFIADFDADGLKDMMILTDNEYNIFKNSGGSVQTDGILHPHFAYKNYHSNETIFNATFSNMKIGDFNGDGLPDFVYNEYGSDYWKLALNTGSEGFFLEQQIWNPYAKDYGVRRNRVDCIVTDYNHDGKSDLILTGSYFNYSEQFVVIDDDIMTHYVYSDSKAFWYKSNGLDLMQEKSPQLSETGLPYINNYTITGDFDGDGRADVLTYGMDIRNGVDKSDQFYLQNSFNTNLQGNILSAVTNGMGKTTQITYQPLTYTSTTDNKPFYTKGSSSVYPMVDIIMPQYCVSKISESNGQGGLLTTEFSYDEARTQLTGVGYLGFKSQTINNIASNKKIVSTTDINSSTYLPEKITRDVSTLDNRPISKNETFITNTQTGNLYESLENKTISTDYLSGLSQTTEYLTYDTYGNPTSIKTTRGDATTTQDISYVQRGSWCPNKPETVTITKTKGNENNIRTVGYSYDTKGNLTSETVDNGDVNQQTVAYSQFNTFGQPTKADITANGNSRSVTIGYTSSGRFINSKTDVLGQTTSYYWDEAKGRLDMTENRLETVNYSYNGLGRLMSVQNMNDISKGSAILWAQAGNAYGALYYVISYSTGNAAVYSWYDALGREVVKETFGLNGNTIRVFTEYNTNGQLYRVSEPTFGATADKWATTYTEYDSYGRPRILTTPMGNDTIEYNGNTTTLKTPTGTKQTVLNSAGQIQSSTVNGKTVTYDYYPSGLARTSTPAEGQAITMQYDLQGNRTKLIDPDAGTIRNVYNGFGELILEKQLIKAGQDSVSTVNTYDETTGLLQTIVRGTETTSYVYDELKRLSTIEIAGQHKQTFTYGDFDRITNVKEEIGSQVYNKQVEYDDYGRVKKEIFPSGYTTFNSYDIYGNLTEVTDASRSIWKAVEANARGQLTKENKGIKQTLYGYDDSGMTTSIQAAGVVDMSYVFDTKGNLFSRTDALTNQKEQFAYEALNRLTNWDIHQNSTNNLLKANSITYDATTGNISTKSDLGNFTLSYGGKRPDGSDIGTHALATIGGVPAGTPTDNLNVTYTNFKKIETLNEGSKSYTVTYGVDQQRRKSVQTVNGVTTTRYYLGDYEEEITGNNVRKIHYLSGGNGLAAIYVQNSTQDSLMYAYTDNQGSLIALTKENGDTIQTYAYDPWGARRNPHNWSAKDSRIKWIVNRGYTMHEHIDAFGIINMNGRVYDPLTAMFLSPDPFIQAPGNWVNYNRYAYCFNNPLIYTDPSGYVNSATGEKSFWEIMRDGGSYFDAFSSTCLAQGNTVFSNNGWGGSGGSGINKPGHWEEVSNTSMIQVTYNTNSSGDKYNYWYTYATETDRVWVPGTQEDRMYDIMHNGYDNVSNRESNGNILQIITKYSVKLASTIVNKAFGKNLKVFDVYDLGTTLRDAYNGDPKAVFELQLKVFEIDIPGLDIFVYVCEESGAIDELNNEGGDKNDLDQPKIQTLPNGGTLYPTPNLNNGPVVFPGGATFHPPYNGPIKPIRY